MNKPLLLTVGIIVWGSLFAADCASPLAPAAYTCADQAREVAAFMATNTTFPAFTTLPSTERVYILDVAPHDVPVHVSGPTCQ